MAPGGGKNFIGRNMKASEDSRGGERDHCRRNVCNASVGKLFRISPSGVEKRISMWKNRRHWMEERVQ